MTTLRAGLSLGTPGDGLDLGQAVPSSAELGLTRTLQATIKNQRLSLDWSVPKLPAS